ncbi:MAG: hypothetical protein NC324_07275 [Bacteroides sp.]|nr:hypothetical protein [Bacteroides sp.]
MGEEKIVHRVDKFLTFKLLTDRDFSAECGLANGTLTQARKKNIDLGKKAVAKILNRYPELNRVWLLTGEGEMLKDNDVSIGSHTTAIAGSGISVNDSVLLDKALSEIAEQRKLVAQGQEQINRLLTLLERK